MAINQDVANQYKQTFFPYASEATDRVRSQGGRFVYYTTAETALKIIRHRELWLRNTAIMNDFSEVEHGLDCIIDAYKSPAGAELDSVLDSHFSDISNEIKSRFDEWIPVTQNDTYVLCISEHTVEEDKYGRLSMWRAYGGTAGVALVLNGDVAFRPSDALAAYSSPVAYMEVADVEKELRQVAENIKARPEFVRAMGREGLKEAIFWMLRFGAICTKHPAFKEEREWRVVASPSVATSPLVPMTVEVLGGVPQKILKIKLQDKRDEGLYGLELPDLLDRILIGPSEHTSVIWFALHEALKDAGFTDPGKKLWQTGIPLRGNQR